MSAIAGMHLSNEKLVGREEVLKMIATMGHRGPDRSSGWSEGSTGFGHCMLWTTPQSLDEHLPASSPSLQLAITADARIDNRDELAAALEVPHDLLGDTPDTTLILLAYKRWGEDCPKRLLGDFAFAIWDKASQTLFCARDHFGVRPFYYYCSGCGFFFASELKALFCLEEVPRLLNEGRVADILTANLQDTAATVYRDILRLPPAHSLKVHQGTVVLRRYWKLDPTRDLRFGSDKEYAEGFRAIFTDAVRARLRSAFPVGSMLSGGLDSSSIVCVARQLLAAVEDQKLHTFSVVFPNTPECDETDYIQAVLEGGGIESHFIDAGKMSPLGNLGKMLNHEDEPFFAPNLFLHWAMYEAACEQRVRVLLDGFDGDTTVSHGIGILQELLRNGRWWALAREIFGLSRRFGRSPWGLLKTHILRPSASAVARRAFRLIGCREEPARTPTDLLNRDFASRLELAKRRVDLRRWDNSRQEHYGRLSHGILPYTLEVADHAAMAFSVEPRYPFFDKRLAEYCLAMPAEQKIFRGWTRMVMRRGMAHILPEKVRWRGGKSDLSPNFVRSLLFHEHKLINQVICNAATRVWEYVDLATLQGLYTRAISSEDRDAGLTLWNAVTLDAWLGQVTRNQKARTRITNELQRNQIISAEIAT